MDEFRAIVNLVLSVLLLIYVLLHGRRVDPYQEIVNMILLLVFLKQAVWILQFVVLVLKYFGYR